MQISYGGTKGNARPRCGWIRAARRARCHLLVRSAGDDSPPDFGPETNNARRLCESETARGGARRHLPGRAGCRARRTRKSPAPTIVGTITDSSGAALPGATVTARNVDTGFTRTVPANESGAYRLEFLPIGSYVVEVTLSGFKTARRSGIVLNVNDTARVDAVAGARRRRRNGERRGAAAPAVNTATVRDLEDHRCRRDPEPAAGRPQRLHAAGSDARRAVQQQRRRRRPRPAPARSCSAFPSSAP